MSSFILTEDGLFARNSRDYGHLGLDKQHGSYPAESWVKIPNVPQGTQIACGAKHAVILTQDGKLYGAESIQSYALGLPHKFWPYYTFTEIPHIPIIIEIA